MWDAFFNRLSEMDVYFKIHKPEHNLDRCRIQFKLVKDMEDKKEGMNEIIKKYM